ncbi:hypothetical protein TanjilG_07422 [Lupinus angustifolius]|uniref:Uncharacterized protein n=1 Tax=Lupinus angustifolius TaxID=3871 RepID=A0A4P1QUQ7_LUPAN|nr:hypothetical protein TanjilG_07422 [Lupinus angustifolius]
MALKDLWIGNYKVQVSKLRFGREEVKDVSRGTNADQSGYEMRVSKNVTMEGRWDVTNGRHLSWKETLIKGKVVDSPNQRDGWRGPKFKISVEKFAEMNDYFVGELKYYEEVRNIRSILPGEVIDHKEVIVLDSDPGLKAREVIIREPQDEGSASSGRNEDSQKSFKLPVFEKWGLSKKEELENWVTQMWWHLQLEGMEERGRGILRGIDVCQSMTLGFS